MRTRDKDNRFLLAWNIKRTHGTFNIAHSNTADIQIYADLEHLKQ
jgi:hypothetical protein